MAVLDTEKMYHIALSKEDIEGAKYAIIPGDPGRVPKIAAFLQNSRQLAYNREYNSYIGELNGEKVLCVSTGIGGPSASICVEELHQLGVENFIRVGTCGGMDMKVLPGDNIVVTGAIRMEGTSKEYLPIEFPAVADLDITVALRDAARKLGLNYHTGVVQCKDSFYGQHSPSRMPVSYELENKWQAWLRGGCLGSEMESAALFTVCAALGVKAGAVMYCVWNQERASAGFVEEKQHDTEAAIRIAIEALKTLIGEKK
ncbi:MAG: uridine phosphorylase [Oscillospiraceae bacterium]|nr:uridine phosphorylase [Oscillospiraceae bacterium]